MKEEGSLNKAEAWAWVKFEAYGFSFPAINTVADGLIQKLNFEHGNTKKTIVALRTKSFLPRTCSFLGRPKAKAGSPTCEVLTAKRENILRCSRLIYVERTYQSPRRWSAATSNNSEANRKMEISYQSSIVEVGPTALPRWCMEEVETRT
jgi:hypothetical protein